VAGVRLERSTKLASARRGEYSRKGSKLGSLERPIAKHEVNVQAAELNPAGSVAVRDTPSTASATSSTTAGPTKTSRTRSAIGESSELLSMPPTIAPICMRIASSGWSVVVRAICSKTIRASCGANVSESQPTVGTLHPVQCARQPLVIASVAQRSVRRHTASERSAAARIVYRGGAEQSRAERFTDERRSSV
jgi:hypothetical protein